MWDKVSVILDWGIAGVLAVGIFALVGFAILGLLYGIFYSLDKRDKKLRKRQRR